MQMKVHAVASLTWIFCWNLMDFKHDRKDLSLMNSLVQQLLSNPKYIS